MIERRFRLHAACALVGWLVMAPAFPAHAEQTPEERSRELFAQGASLAEQSRWTEACPLFQAAHDLSATGGTALQAANCYEKTEKLARALDMYRFIAQNPDARKNAERLAYAAERIKFLEEKLGAKSSSAQTPSSTTTSPGKTDGAQGAIAPVKQDTAQSATPSRTPGIALLGVGAAGFVVGGIFGGLALAQSDALNEKCPGTVCPTSLQGEADGAITKGWISNVGFGVGVVGAAVGVILLVTAKPATASRVAVGPDGIRLRF